MTKAKLKARDEARAELKTFLKPSDTVYTILDHVSRNGMSRAIRIVVPSIEGIAVESTAPGGKPTDYIRKDSTRVDFLHPNYLVGTALGLRHWKRNGHEQDALVMGGCGMDMGFSLVYELSHALYGGGYQCLGQGKCPSNYHVNYRSSIRCEGYEGRFCHAPSRWSGEKVPEDWPTNQDGSPAACLFADHELTREICPTCLGVGSLPNPDGPERFDLLHTDGYALKHRWL